MQKIDKIEFKNKKQFYNYLNLKLTGLICEEPDWLANLSNTASLLWLLLENQLVHTYKLEKEYAELLQKNQRHN